MTKEEAIETIKELMVACVPNSKYYRVGEMAIKALEQEPTTKNDLGVDWESYKDVDGNSLDDLILEVLQNNFDCGNTYGYKVADEIIGLLPSTPQEPILDKIRAEIETKYGQCDICEYFEDYDFDENDISEYRPIGNIADILQIIDKYKTESE